MCTNAHSYYKSCSYVGLSLRPEKVHSSGWKLVCFNQSIFCYDKTFNYLFMFLLQFYDYMVFHIYLYFDFIHTFPFTSHTQLYSKMTVAVSWMQATKFNCYYFRNECYIPYPLRLTYKSMNFYKMIIIAFKEFSLFLRLMYHYMNS